MQSRDNWESSIAIWMQATALSNTGLIAIQCGSKWSHVAAMTDTSTVHVVHFQKPLSS